MKTKLFTLLLAVAASVGTMFAESGFCGYDLTWNLTGKVLTISGTGAMFDYYSDTTPWYSYRSSITTVIIKDGATSIGVYAFYGCTGLTSVTIPNSVTSIGDCAFYWCTGLTSVTIPNSVTSIGSSAFYGCSSLTSVTIPNRVTSIKRSAFSRCSSLTSVTIPNGVTSIGEAAFSGCSAMTSINIPSSVTSIGEDAFGSVASGYCTALTRVNITNLSAWCNISFSNNLSNPLCFAHHLYLNGAEVKNVIIPSNKTDIGNYTFAGCSGLTSITIPSSITSIGQEALSGCSGLTSIEIPNSVTSIGSGAFLDCSGLTSVTIPNSVTSIEYGTFRACSSLTSIEISKSLTSIGSRAFEGCNIHTINFIGSIEDWCNKTWSPGSVSGSYQLQFNGVLQEDIIIPNSVDSIGENAFRDCTGLTSITIGNSVTSIGNDAFYNCSNLTSIIWNAKNGPSFNFGNQVTSFTFGDDVEVIPASICSGMKNLTSVTIGNSVDSIGENAFRGCTGLTSVTIPDSVTSIGEYAFAYCTGMTSETIGNSVTSIGQLAFYGCTSLTSITIGNSVTSIEYNAFYNCSNLTSIIWNAKNGPSFNFGNQVTSFTFGDDVEVIPASICSGMTNLTSITIGNSVDSIGENAFRGCTSLASVMWNAKACKNFTYDNTPFYNGGSYSSRFDIRSQITSFTFGDTVEKIPSYLCSGMTNLTSVTIPNSVTNIEYSAFSGCSGLTSVTIPNSVTSIGSSTFAYCSSLTSVTIPNSVTGIGGGAFDGCTGLTSVTIPNSVTSIGNYAFHGCTGLTSIEIPNSVTSIGDLAFSGCTGLTSVTIGNSVTSIGDEAFEGCSSLTSIIWNAKNGPSFNFGNQVTSFTFGDDVEVIPASICYRMTNLTSITIPNSVTSIGNGAFSECTGLTSINIPDSVTSIGTGAFYNCSGLTSIDVASKNPNYCSVNGVLLNKNRTTLISYPGGKQGAYSIPNSVTSIGNYAFYNCSGLTSVTIPDSVTSIGESAFRGCSGLTSVTCLAPTPPTCWSSKCFSKVNCSNIPLYVPMESVSLYQAANIWKEFNVIGVMFADEVETAVFSATPTDDYGVILEWQAVENAVLYNIDIIQGNDTIRELQFDSNGKLLNSPSNAPSRYPNIHHASTAILSGNGWRYEVNDLDPGTNYTYSITVKAENGSVLYTQSIGFTTKEETFIIKFVNWNGEELLVLPEVVKGTTPSYTGETPVRPNTAEYTYTFVGWTPAIVAATSDTTYTATFTATKNSYTITWQNEDGSLIDQTTVEYGVVPTHAEPTKQATAEYTYTFAGWTPAVVAVTGDATYTATFSSVVNVYTITVNAVNGQVLGGGKYQYGTTTDLTAIPDEGYVFDQWSDGVTDNPRTITVTGDVEYTALFKSAEGFENIYTSEPVQKVIIDQKVYILRGEKVYNAQGALVK